jgi:cysteine desulfurase
MAKRKIYLDYAATTPIDRRVFSAMLPYFTEEFGNPSNLYGSGLKAKRALAEATRKITAALDCAPDEFIFTGSATEADNLAILGVARANKERGNRIIISNVEHKGILAVCDALKHEGFEIVELPVGKNGLVDPAEIAKALDEKTILVSVTCADSETGTTQPIAEISKIIKAFRKKKRPANPMPYFHTDASQAALYLDINVGKLGVDLMTLSAHKLYGPKGIGGLYVWRGTEIDPIIFGGGQQRRLRSGTENVPAIVGFGEAMALAQKHRKAESARVKKLRDRLEGGIFKTIPKVVLNGHPTKRLPNFLNVSVLDIEGEAMLLCLDEKGIFVNTGSACNSESLEPSYVLTALGNPYEYVHGSIRFTLGKKTTASDVDYVLRELPLIVARLRKISPLNLKLGKKEKIAEPKAFVGGRTPHFLQKKYRMLNNG